MNIYEKLLKVREDFLDSNIKKSGKNSYSKFDYFELADIVPTITKLCMEVKAVTVIDYSEDKATMRFVNAEKPDEYIEIHCDMKMLDGKQMNAVQAYGAVQTYVRRYLYLTMFDIVEADTLDALDNRPKAMEPEQPKAKKEQPQKKPGKMSEQNKKMMNKLIMSYAKAASMKIQDVTKQIEDYFETACKDMTDEMAPQVFDLLETLIKEASQEAQSA